MDGGVSDGPDYLSAAVRAHLERARAEYDDLSQQLGTQAVLADHRLATTLAQRRAALEPLARAWTAFQSLETELAELTEAQRDPELAELAAEERQTTLAELERSAETLKASLVTADDRAVGSVILEIRAGTGGDEAALWARDLLGVYERFGARRRWRFDTLDLSEEPGAGGVRSAILQIEGDGVWADLAFESGVHSVKRVPATETQGRIHTSTCTVAVLPEPRDVEVSIDWQSDVIEHVTTSQGPGGQNVNKVATAVHLVHTPTGVEVRMQETKSQAQNRERARRLLMARVYDIERARVEAERAQERRSQIGSGGRSEKVRTYRYQDNIVADQRVDRKFSKTQIIDEADLSPLLEALQQQQTAERLAAL